MKKRIIIVMAIVVAIVTAIGIGALITLSLFQEPQDVGDESNTLHWLSNESEFIDYKIEGNTISFRYSICFVNNSDIPAKVSLYAKFPPKELKGWVKDDDFFVGCDDDGTMIKETIDIGEKKEIIFTFSGEYLGGEVNTDLSFPEEIILMS